MSTYCQAELGRFHKTTKAAWDLQNLKVGDHEHIATAKRMKADGHTGKDIAKYPGVCRATLYRYLSRQGAAGS